MSWPCSACGSRAGDVRPGRASCQSHAEALIETVADLRRCAAMVEQALIRRGMVVDARVVVKLRNQRALMASGLFTDPDQLGVTTMRAAAGRRPRAIQIALSAGMPGALARAVLAHEYGHALLFDRMVHQVPPILGEGFAEFVAHTYLTLDESTCAARTAAAEQLRQPDPVYGAGLRLIRARVAERGFASVWAALRSSDHTAHARLIAGERPTLAVPSTRAARSARVVGSTARAASGQPSPTPRRSTP